MLKKFLLGLMFVFVVGVGGIVGAGNAEVRTQVTSYPGTYPCTIISYSEFLIYEQGSINCNYVFDQNGAGTGRGRNVEFTVRYISSDNPKLHIFDWSRDAGHVVHLASAPSTKYIAKRDHDSSAGNTPPNTTYWQVYTGARASSEWVATGKRYMYPKGDGDLSAYYYELSGGEWEPYGYHGGQFPPTTNINFTSTKPDGTLYTSFENRTLFLGTEYKDGRTQEKWRNEVALWDFTATLWKTIYTRTYYTDIGMNNDVGRIDIYQPWLETHNKSTCTNKVAMMYGAKFGFANSLIKIPGVGTWLLTSGISTFYKGSNWSQVSLSANYSWTVEWIGPTTCN